MDMTSHMERVYCQDYRRLGMPVGGAIGPRHRVHRWRLSLVNSDYAVCKRYVTSLRVVAQCVRYWCAASHRVMIVTSLFVVSYPALLVVPSTVTDDSIKTLARSHRQCRSADNSFYSIHSYSYVALPIHVRTSTHTRVALYADVGCDVTGCAGSRC